MGGAGFWRNFNVFVAGFLLASGMGAFLVYIPLAALARLVLSPGRAEMIALPATYVAIAAALAWIWRRHGLSPRQRLPERERRFRTGHVLLVTFNLLVLAGMAPSFVPPSWLHALAAPALAPLFMVLPMALTLAGIAGLLMVLSARVPPPSLTEATDFADTVVERQQGAAAPAVRGSQAVRGSLPVAGPQSLRGAHPVVGSQSVRGTQPVGAPQSLRGTQPVGAPQSLRGAQPMRRPQVVQTSPLPRTSRGAWLGIGLGVAATALVTYIAVVFAATGFQGRVQLFTGVVVPVAAGAFVAYLAAALWLGRHRRARAAIGVAWAPVVLLVVGLPLLQGVWLVLRAAFGR